MEKKLLLAYLDIPKLRGGKSDVGAIISYQQDCEMYWKLLTSYFMDVKQGKKLLKEWKEFIQLRNDEDFCIHSQSKNYSKYQTMMDWKLI